MMSDSLGSDDNGVVSSPILGRMFFEELSETVCRNSGMIIGCIVNCYQIQQSSVFGKLRKLLLRDVLAHGTLGDRLLPCFLYGEFVDQTRALRRGQILTVKNFEVQHNIHYQKDDIMYPHQVDVIVSAEIKPVVTLSEKKMVRFGDLEMISESYGGVCIVGRITNSYDLKETESKDTIKRIIIKDVLPDDSLGNVFMECILYDKIALKNKPLRVGDTIKLTGFIVEARPSTSAAQNFYQYQVVLDPKRERCYDENPSLVVIKSSQKKNGHEVQSKPAAYEYTSLKDLEKIFKQGQAGKKHYNVYGVVVQCVILNSSLNECLRIVVRDPSLDSFTIFVRTRPGISDIPDISPNDIIRFHRIYLEQYRNGCQGICYTTRDLLVFSSKHLSAEPIHTSRTYTWTDDDEKTLADLQTWWSSEINQNINSCSSGWISAKKSKDVPANGQCKNCQNIETSSTKLVTNDKLTSPTRSVSSVSTQTPPKMSTSSPKSVTNAKKSKSSVCKQTPPNKSSSLGAKSVTSPGLSLACTDTARKPRLSTIKIIRNPTDFELRDRSLNSEMIVTFSKLSVTEATSPAHASECPVEAIPESSQTLNSARMMSNAESQEIIPPTPEMNKMPNAIKRKLNFSGQNPNKKRISSLSSSADKTIVNSVLASDAQETTEEDISTLEAYPISKQINNPLNLISVPVNSSQEAVVSLRDLKNAQLFVRFRVQARVTAMNSLCTRTCTHCHYLFRENQNTQLTFFQINNQKIFLCPKCEASKKRGSILESCLMFYLKLDDGSDVINVSLYGKHASYFLSGLKPNVSKNLDKVRETMDNILFVSSRRNPPILDCYLIKYMKRLGHGFQIVDTKLLF